MDDFLQTIRNNSMDKKFNKPRRNYGENNSFPAIDKRTGIDRRDVALKKSNAQVYEGLESIKNIMEDMVENQEQIFFVQERHSYTLERQANVLEKMSYFLEKITERLMSGDIPQPVSGPIRSSDPSLYKITTSKKPNGPDKKIILEIIERMRNDGETYHTIAQFLAREEFPTFSGKGDWHAQTVHRLCQRIDAKKVSG